MKKFVVSFLSISPVPFFILFFEYNCHLAGKSAKFLIPVFLVFIIVVGISSRNIKFPLFFGLNLMMTVISLLFGSFLLVDDGGWFKPFGRDVAIIFVSIIYILGQFIIRVVSKLGDTNNK